MKKQENKNRRNFLLCMSGLLVLIVFAFAGPEGLLRLQDKSRLTGSVSISNTGTDYTVWKEEYETDTVRRENIRIALEKQVLIASLGAKLKISKCKAIRDWFVVNEFADFGNPMTNYFLSRRLPKGFVEDKNVQQKVVEYFTSFDEHIKDFRVEKVPNDGESKEDKYKINALHKMIDSDKMAEIPLGAESAGTLKMFALYPELQEVLEKGSVFFIDELNARLHPLLVRNFLLTFLNPNINVNHAQLVFTTHDTWQLSNQLLRRDEIWFVEKDDRGVSTLYSLADFVDEDGARIRKDESYEKNYLIGKYGAIPTLKSIDLFKED